MTVAELIAKLQALPNHNLRVITRGYEGGYHDCGEPEDTKIRLNINKEWYYGPHEDARVEYNEETGKYDNAEYDEIAIYLGAANRD